MRIAVVSCRKYRDCLLPFFSLFRKFWVNCPHEVWLLTDSHDTGPIPDKECRVFCAGESKSWCSVVTDFARAYTDEAILLMQEDFLINATVNELLIEKGLQQLIERNAAMARIYPCPGGDIPYGDKWYAEIPKGTRYRVSAQASIWDPISLLRISSFCETPSDFEITGSELSDHITEPFLAFRRDVQPWPLSYYCSAISRGKWEPAALEFCKQNGIEVDTSMREVA